jgi:phosphoglycolate phosphatase
MPSPAFKAALFDLDGTLLDTLEDLGDSLNATLTAQGLPLHAYGDYRLMVGHGLPALVRQALPEDWRAGERFQTIFDAFIQLYRANQRRRTRPYPEVPELLTALQAAGLRLAVLSNKNQANVTELIDSFFPGLFEAARGLCPSVPAKPDPAAALALARDFDLPPGAFLYLGDSGLDMRTARAAGMRAVGVTWGYRTRAELAAEGAEDIIDSPGEVLRLIS